MGLSERPKWDRRELLKGAVKVAAGVGAVAMMPKETGAQSTEKQQEPEEILADLKSRTNDVSTRVEKFKSLSSAALRRSIAGRFAAELIRRISEAKDIVQAKSIEYSLGYRSDDHQKEVEGQYAVLEELEKEVTTLLQTE